MKARLKLCIELDFELEQLFDKLKWMADLYKDNWMQSGGAHWKRSNREVKINFPVNWADKIAIVWIE